MVNNKDNWEEGYNQVTYKGRRYDKIRYADLKNGQAFWGWTIYNPNNPKTYFETEVNKYHNLNGDRFTVVTFPENAPDHYIKSFDKYYRVDNHYMMQLKPYGSTYIDYIKRSAYFVSYVIVERTSLWQSFKNLLIFLTS